MAEYNLSSAQASDMTNVVGDVTIQAEVTDGASEAGETRWTNPDWSKYWGFFNNSPDLKSAMLMKATWNVGKGYETDEDTKIILERINGWGKDTFDDILFNMEVIRRVNGDAFAEIIRRDDGTLINLKPLDPSTMVIIVDAKGIIVRYEQESKVEGKKPIKFQPEDMFHLSNNRLADQIHGISDIKVMEETLLAENESFTDMKTIMHHQARPMIMFKLGTDNTTKINAFAKKMDNAVKKGENIYVPIDKDAVDFEVVSVNVSQIVLAWRDDIRNRFYRALGLPQIIFGSAGTTESGGKIEYLAHEQVFEKDQRYLENQILNQLGITIDLLSPVSLLENLQTDENKDAQQGLEVQPQDASVPTNTTPEGVPNAV